jgi:hypothetical protein
VRTDPYSHPHAFCTHFLCPVHLFFSMIFDHHPPPWPLSFLPHGSRRWVPGRLAAADGAASLANMRPGDFVFFTAYALASLALPLSSFLTLLEYYGL